MSNSEFEFLINFKGEKISKKDTAFRKAISVQERLALTLGFLASGDSYVSLRGLWCGSAAALLLGLRVRIPPGAWTSVCC